MSRRLRGGALAVVSIVLGAAAHAAAGGVAPHPSVLLPVAALTAAAGTCLSGRGLHPVRAIGVLTASQLTMQALFLFGHRAAPHVHAPVSRLTAVAGYAATVVAISLLLAYADRLLVRLAVALAAVVPVRLTVSAPVVRVPAALPARSARDNRWQTVLLARACPRRGPPRGAFAV